jgi:HlyD family secretion protein
MKKLIPIVVLLLGFVTFVYFSRILPSRHPDPRVRGSGTIEADTVAISPKIAARLLTIGAEESATVAAGQSLLSLQCDEQLARQTQAGAQVAQAKAAEQQARAAAALAVAQTRPLVAQRDQARRDQERNLVLAKSEAVTTRMLEQSATALLAAEDQLKAAELAVSVTDQGSRVAAAQIEVAERALGLATTQVAECDVRSPITGTVLSRNYEPGELVMPGATVLKLGSLEQVYTWIYVANEEVGRVHLGQKVELSADTYPGRVFAGVVARVKEEAEFTPRSVQTKEDRTRLVYGVKVTIANADHALMPGMPVEAVLIENPAPAAIGARQEPPR